MQGKPEPIDFVYRPSKDKSIPDQVVHFQSKPDALHFAENIIDVLGMVGVKSKKLMWKRRER